MFSDGPLTVEKRGGFRRRTLSKAQIGSLPDRRIVDRLPPSVTIRRMSPKTFFITFLIVTFILGIGINSASQTRAPTPRAGLTTADIAKLHWIEGTWRGTGDVEHPFFERYRIENESTLAVDSFEDEKLTRVTDTTRYELRNGEFGGGNEGFRWVATFVGVDSIDFAPVAKANNSFTWRRETRDSWVAILSWPAAGGKPAGQRVYKMERFPSIRSQDVTRAFIAASGKDANACSFDSPCRTVNRALQTFTTSTRSGTVTIIESGDYEQFEIAEQGNNLHIAITVEAAPGVTATITGRSQNAGVYIHVGSQDRVVLRNLHLDSGSGNVGIDVKSGAWTYVENCSISNFDKGIDIRDPSELFVTDSFFKRNGDGILAGSDINPSGGVTKGPPSVSVDNCRFELESRSAVTVRDGAKVVIRNSVIAGTNDFGVICTSNPSGMNTKLFIENTSITGGGFKCVGLCIDTGAGLWAGDGKSYVEVTLSNTVITQNRVGVIVGANATVFTYKNNRINTNGTKETDNVRGNLKPVYYQ